MDTFQKAVIEIVRAIPHGHVMSYGQVAAYLGVPRNAREVGWAMNGLGSLPDFPWWRVLNSAGKISLQENPNTNPQMQQRLLEQEGIEFQSPLQLDIERYRWRADKAALKKLGLNPEQVESVLEKYDAPKSTQSLF